MELKRYERLFWNGTFLVSIRAEGDDVSYIDCLLFVAMSSNHLRASEKQALLYPRPHLVSRSIKPDQADLLAEIVSF